MFAGVVFIAVFLSGYWVIWDVPLAECLRRSAVAGLNAGIGFWVGYRHAKWEGGNG